MPTKNKWDRIKSDPIRYEKHKKKKNEEQKQFRKKSVLRYLTYKTNSTVKNRGNFTVWELWCKVKKQKLLCALTGRSLTSENLSVDHIIPLSKNGMNTIDNIQLVDKDANMARRCLSVEEFVKLCHDVVRKSTERNG